MSDSFFYRPDANELKGTPIRMSERNKETLDIEIHECEKSQTGFDRDSDFLNRLSTHFLICNEKIPGRGEDSGFEAYTSRAGVIGAFDGCGGLGSKTCEAVSGKTEAYLASRAVCNAVRMWFYRSCEADSIWDTDLLKDLIISNLSICQTHSGAQESLLKGTLVRPFPSTMAVAAFAVINGELWSEHIWAGDSRTYIIDSKGIGQTSSDDIKGEDAMSNLTRDGALTNVLSADQSFKIHKRRFQLTEPCIVLSASDGCFGYVSSPMEFEDILLSTLVNASNVDEWKNSLNEEISVRAGDDQTIAIAAFGFSEFSEMKEYYLKQHDAVKQIVQKFDKSDEEERQRLWEDYKPNYYRFSEEK